ncbi:macrolide 2'-phosphotransferase [Leucobacter sp. UCD-THU]|uniref:phosphotransferase n=1 Tax=Leucobacter sp. UCD-THU TaxID=1292023 RepID=UPI000367B765|nr:phosphotransferase [Leucobacter sp. UCD-THU]EYT52972.1 macrolide 2'-phosphotransferase [Leucobacter sp. UCD-THU]
MATIPFTLAALATSAVPGLVVFGVRAHEGDESFASAVVAGEDAELLVRVPRTQAAEVQQSAELLGIAALTEGPRSRLPFEVPETLGMTRAGDTRAVVTTMLGGARFEAEDLSHDARLLQPIAEAIGAIHDLPTSVAQQGGLPVRSAQDLRLLTTRLIDRAEATRLLPETVLRRWQQTVETADIWDFTPTVVHGSLDAEQLFVDDDRITGVTGWSELSVGDPASDLAWLLAAGSDVLDSALARYAQNRNTGSLSHLRVRAALYHELEVARWLLHGVESHDQAVIDDAVSMLDRMVGSSGALGAAFSAAKHRSPLDESEVTALLDETPEVADHLSDTAAYEALDEDRMFGVDTDFIEPLREGGDEEAEASPSGGGEPAEDGAEHMTEPLSDQLTQPIDDEDLPETPAR